MADMTEVIRAAEELGRTNGCAAGSWVFDGNVSDDYVRRVLQGIADGDPEIMDMAPAPLSGEWAGESIPELMDDSGVDRREVDGETEAAWCNAYEEAYGAAFWAEVERSGRAMLGDGVIRCSGCGTTDPANHSIGCWG